MFYITCGCEGAKHQEHTWCVSSKMLCTLLVLGVCVCVHNYYSTQFNISNVAEI